MKSMPFHVQTGDTLVHGEELIGCVPSPLMGEGQGEGEKSEAPSTVPLTPALPARGAGEKSVVSYQTYGSNDMRSMIIESVR